VTAFEPGLLQFLYAACASLSASAGRISYAPGIAVPLIVQDFGDVGMNFPPVASPFRWSGPALPRLLSADLIESAFYGPDGSASRLLIQSAPRPDVGSILAAHAKLHAAYDNAYSRNTETSSSPARLNDREKNVLAYAALGLSSKEIAQELGISARTVDYYVDLARDKLGAHNRTEAIVRGILTRQICALKLPGEREP